MNFREAKYGVAFAACAFNLVEFTIGAETGGDTINVGIVVKDARGNPPTGPCILRAFLSDVATGLGISAVATTTAPAVGTDGSLLSIDVTGKMMTLQTDAEGAVDINVIQTAAQTYYLVVILPDGSIAVSGAITFA